LPPSASGAYRPTSEWIHPFAGILGAPPPSLTRRGDDETRQEQLTNQPTIPGDHVSTNRSEQLPQLPADARVLLVGSSGGHLAQLWALAPLWSQRQRHWVTFDTADAVSLLRDEAVTWAFHPTTRNAVNLARNSLQARQVMRQVAPDVVISSGAAVAYPYFLIARRLGVPTLYLEVYDRVESSTMTGRLCRPHASVFAVQWPEQEQLYDGAVVVGAVL